MTCAETYISTDAVALALRNDYWRQVTRPFCEAIPVSATLEGTMQLRHVGGLTLGSTRFNAQRYKRDRAMVARSGLDHYLVHVVVAGSIHGDFDNRDVVAVPGEICFIDLARPYQCRVDAGMRLAMTVPRAALDKALGARDVHGLVLHTADPMTRLLGDYLQGFHAVAGRMSANEHAAALESLAILLSAGLLHAPEALQAPASVLGQALRARVLDYIDRHLAEAALGPALLAQRFRVSRAHLYRTFADLGGIACVIKNKRLDASFAQLAAPRTAALSVSQVAARYGFRHMTRFRQAFVARFGVAPEQASEVHACAWRPGDQTLLSHFSTLSQTPFQN